jgi:hypothetical protein
MITLPISDCDQFLSDLLPAPSLLIFGDFPPTEAVGDSSLFAVTDSVPVTGFLEASFAHQTIAL